MPDKKTIRGNTSPEHLDELKSWWEKNKHSIESFQRAQEALQLLDYTKSGTTRTYSTFSKETLRTYMENPLSYYEKLRQLSTFLYYRSQQYRRLIWYNATAIDLNARSVIPLVDFTKEINQEQMTRSYYETLKVLEDLNLPLEFLKVYVTCWREDVFFGIAYYVEGQGMFIYPVDPSYCKISGAYYTGDFSYVVDMSKFRSQQDLLNLLGDPLLGMYNDYLKDTVNGRWQPMPDEYAVCLKINIDDIEIPLPPYMGLFNSLINLIDLEDLQAIQDSENIYKLLVATLPRIDGSTDVDDWAVDPGTVTGYVNRAIDTLPSYANLITSPIPIDTIDFSDDQSTDTDRISQSTEALFDAAGGGQILYSSGISGTTAWLGAIKQDQEYSISALLPETQGWVNRFISYYVTNPAKVKFHEVTVYTKDTYKDSLLKDAQFGLPVAMTLNNLNGFSDLETLSMVHLQNALGIPEIFKPLQSSYTQSGTSSQEVDPDDPLREGGGQTKDVDDLTDDGEASIDKRDNAR